MEYIYTEEAPDPGNYSQAVKYNGQIFVSGQTADDPVTHEPLHGTITEQTELILNNIKTILEAAGSGVDKIIKCNVYLTEMEHKKEFDEAYGKFFTEHAEKFPARIAMAVKGFDAGLDVEIDVIAAE